MAFVTRFAVLLALAGLSPTRAEDPAPAKIDFNRDVRPILSNNCFQCHGPDEKVRKGEAPPRHPRRGDRARPSCPASRTQSELIQRVAQRTSRRGDAAGEDRQEAHAARGRDPDAVDQGGGEVRVHWAYVKPVRPAVPASPETRGWVTQPDRSLHPRPAGEGRARAAARGRPVRPRPPRRARPDRPAADAGGGRRVRRRQVAGRLREARRPAAGEAGVRRTLGADVARPGPLRRLAPATPTTRRGPSGSTATTSSTRFNANMPFDQFTDRAARRRPAAEPDRRSNSSRPRSTATR